MSNPILPVEFEKMIMNISNVPEPDVVFQNSLRERFIAKGVSFSNKASRKRMDKRQILSTLKWALVIAVIVALTLIATSPTVVAALKKLLGYVPGLGLVEQNTPFHILVEPVSQTRDGVTITVEKAIVNEASILLTYKIEGLTSDKASPLEALNTCFSPSELRFPNGESVLSNGGFGDKPLDGGMTFDTRDPVYGFESNIRFPVPAGLTSATFFIPCISGALSPGILPENWELPLHFVPAPPDVAMTIYPVIEVSSPTPVAMLASESTPSPATGGMPANPLTLTKVIDAGDNGYILFGELNPPAPSQPGEWRIDWVSLDIVDNNGQTVFWQNLQDSNDIDVPASDRPRKLAWAIVIRERGFALPLHITQRARYAISANSRETYTFEFDAEENPQPLQEWNLNQEIQFDGHTIRLTRINANPVRTGYIFSFETNDNSVNSLSARIDGYPSIEHLTFPILLPGSNISQWDYYEYYSESLPAGKLKVFLSDLYLNGETKDWTLEWLP